MAKSQKKGGKRPKDFEPPDPKRWDKEPRNDGRGPRENRPVVKFEPRNEDQAVAWRAMDRNDLIFFDGPPGAAKTFMCVAKSVERLEKKEIRKIYATRAAVEAGESIGALPGTEHQKMEAYLMPILMAFEKILGKSRLEAYIGAGKVVLKAPQFLQGWTIEDADLVVDEAQNLTVDQMRMLATRLGERAKGYFAYDPGQINLKNKAESCAWDLERFKGKPGIAFIKFGARHIVRSRIAQTAYECYH